MAEENQPASADPRPRNKNFEQLKLVNQHDAEYWSARDLQDLLGKD